MKNFSLAAFLALVLATIAAFFIAQHLKVTTPLIVVGAAPQPFPATIDPLGPGRCYDPVSHALIGRSTRISFYLLHASDKVDVYVVDAQARRVATLASDRFMKAVRFPDEVATPFTWDGRERDGTVAPDGTYDFQVQLIHQGRTVTISSNSGPLPVTVDARARCR